MILHAPHPIEMIPPWDEKKQYLNVIVETPKGSRNKYEFDAALGIFKLSGTITLGHSFPFDFGFVPQTIGGDGDPLDVLVLMEETAFTGCLVECRLIGGLKAYQTERNGKKERNDRLLAVWRKSAEYADVTTIDHVSTAMLDQIEHFFVSYNEARGKTFKVAKRFGVRTANSIVKKGTVTEITG